jgi:UDP-N-acetylenolpyruvoylglucosamine reductase
VNVDSARAADVERLVAQIQQEVKQRFGVALTPEFRAVGEAG